MSSIRIIKSDAIRLLKSLGDNSVTAVVTSPPYNIGVNYRSYTDRRDDWEKWMIKWIKEAIRISRKGVMLNIGSKASNHAQLFRMLGSLAKSGIHIQNVIIWIKHFEGKGHFKPLNSKRYVNNLHEYVIHLSKSGDSNINRLKVGVSYSDKTNIKRFGHKEDLRCRGSVWFIPYKTKRKKNYHPATYPLKLAKMMIKFVMEEDSKQWICDPFLGSGTTAVAALKLNVRFIGGDLDPKYVAMARRRIRLRKLRIG